MASTEGKHTEVASPTLVSAESIREAADRLSGIAVRTPLVDPWIDGLPAGTRLKLENLQRTGAFKFRGAYTMVSRLPTSERGRGLITFSSGNHGQAVALAARLFDAPCTVVMPEDAVREKVDAVRRHGAEVLFHGTVTLQRKERAVALAREKEMTVVPPYEHPDIIAGQGTVGVEILEDWPNVEAVLVPVGAGGQASGVAAWVKRSSPSCAVIGVEPAGSDVMNQSLRAGRRVTLETPDTVADGLRSDQTGPLVFAHFRALMDEMVQVDDDEICHAARVLLHRGKVLAEFSGATAVAAIMSRRWSPDGRRTAVVVSGGNVSPQHPQLAWDHEDRA